MKFYLDTIGCRLNQSEVEKMAMQLKAAGHIIVADTAAADWVIVNTCAVTAEAGSDSRQKIRQAARNGNAGVIVTGCWATLDPALAASLPRVQRVVSNSQKESLVHEFLSPDASPRILRRQSLPGTHTRTRAFIKVQDGCDNYCTFCITRLVRGASRSLAAADILDDVRARVNGGAVEVVLSGVNLGAWGRDINPPSNLKTLILMILDNSPVSRLRLSSLEPWDLDAPFFDLWSNSRLCRHLHLPLQSGSESVLRRMGRKTSTVQFRELVAAARQSIPGLAVTTDVMTGFPGENMTEFDESLEFIQEMGFASGHVFSFSPRPGTPAEKMRDRVAPAEIRNRNGIIRSVFTESNRRFQAGFVGAELKVLWESTREMSSGCWELEGWSDNYIRVKTHSTRKIWNEISRVRIKESTGCGMLGEITGSD